MFLDFIPLYIAALVLLATAMTAKAWFGYKADRYKARSSYESVRYQEDTKRLLGTRSDQQALNGSPEPDDLRAEED